MLFSLWEGSCNEMTNVQLFSLEDKLLRGASCWATAVLGWCMKWVKQIKPPPCSKNLFAVKYKDVQEEKDDSLKLAPKIT